jgi:GTP-binding protein LepA
MLYSSDVNEKEIFVCAIVDQYWLDVGIRVLSRGPWAGLTRRAPCRYAGQVGYITANMKTSSEARVGDTFFRVGSPVEPMAGFKEAKPMVWSMVCAIACIAHGMVQPRGSVRLTPPSVVFEGNMSCLAMQVFAGIFPIDASEHETLQQAIDKLTLNDASVSVTKTRRYIMGKMS